MRGARRADAADGSRGEQTSSTVSASGYSHVVCQTSQEAQGQQADDERTGGAHDVRVDQRAESPPGQQLRLVRRHLQALSGLEDHGAVGEGREDPYRPDDRGGDGAAMLAATGQQLAPDQEGQPERRHHHEADQWRELVEVAGDQPDDADADERGPEGEQETGEVEPAGRVVRREDGVRGAVVDEARRTATGAARRPAIRAGRVSPAGSGRTSGGAGAAVMLRMIDLRDAVARA